MSEKYTHQLLRVVVAQVCQTIGWHSIQSTPLELLIDILDQYLRDITRLTHRYAELYNRTDPNLDDVALAYQEIGMNLGELQEYLQYVDPIERPFEVPRYPLPKESHLNFLKPGSKEVLTRPVHIPEHMPPMLVDAEEEQEEARRRLQRQRDALLIDVDNEDGVDASSADVKPEYDEVIEKMEEVGAEEVALMETSQNEEVVTFKRPPEVSPDGATETKKPRALTEEGRPTREISSVIMTTSGFISPAREGKLPDSKPPIIPEEMPKPPPPPPPAPAPALPVAKIDDKFNKKPKKKPVEKEKKKDKKGDKKKDGNDSKNPSRPPTPGAEPPSTLMEDIKPLPVEQSKPPAPLPDAKPLELQPPPPPPLEQEKSALAAPIPIGPSPAKPKKERPKKKKTPPQPKLKSPLPQPPLMPLPGQLVDVGLFPPQQPLLKPPAPTSSLLPSGPAAPLVNQITPPKPPKPKRPKLTKKQRQQQQMEQQMMQFQQPLSAQAIIDMFTPGKKPQPGLFQPSLFPQPPQQQLPQKFPDTSAQTQLDILQKLHPSLEITPAPGPGMSMHSPSPDKHKLNIFKKVAKKEPTPSPTLTSQGPIIVIDDDKSPPHQPQFPITPTIKKRAPKSSQVPNTPGFPFQDTLSSPDFGMTPGEHSGMTGASYREFSPPKTPSNMPKTPDIKLQSSSSSSTSWMSDSGKLTGAAVGPGPLFGDFPNFGLPPVVPKEEKKKKPRQRAPKESAAAKRAKNAQMLEGLEMLQQLQQQQMAPAPIPGLDKKQLSEYSKLLNQALPQNFLGPQARNPGVFGMFPLPSGPGLIPDNPLFNTFPGQPSFLPTGPFGMPIPPRFDMNMLRYPRPPKPQTSTGESFDLDPETKLAHTPLDLQKSTCNVAPLVPPSLQIDPVPAATTTVAPPPPQEHSLNLSTKSAKSVITAIPKATIPSSAPATIVSHQPPGEPVVIKASSTLMPTQQHYQPAPAVPQQHLLAAAAPTVPPITPGETIVIGSDSDTNSQSTVTMTAMGISPPPPGSSKKDKLEKRKNKEHKKDKKLKEGKIKKKKDKKDKNKSKDRDRERPKSSHSFHMDSAPVSILPASATINPDMGVPEQQQLQLPSALPSDFPDPLLEQMRRKEKKEKKKEKLKKEKRKEKERAAAAALEAASTSGFGFGTASGNTTIVSEHVEGPPISVPKLMLKLGSNSTPSPRSGTPDHHSSADVSSAGEAKREASPELARFTALVTRPPKLKTPSGKGKKDDDGKPSKAAGEHAGKSSSSKLDFSGDPSKPRPRGIQALPDSIDLFSVTPTHTTVQQPSKVSPGLASSASSSVAGPSAIDPPSTPHTSKKAPKEPKSSKSHGSSSSSASASLGVTIPAPLNTPINVKDADGNVVWICPACGRVDDGTPMIGCDGCDAWYHWVCVGIQVPPDSNEDWYCRVCIGRKQESHGADEKQKKRKKKDKRNPKD